MFKEKYLNIFSRQLEATASLLSFKYFLEALEVLKIVEYHSYILQFLQGNFQSGNSFKPVACGRKLLMDLNK